MTSISQTLNDSFASLQGLAGVSVTYTRNTRAVTLTAVPGSTDFEVDTGDIIETMQSRDFLILASELILGGFATLPKRGDTIREVIGGVETTYNVRAPAGEKHFRFDDPYRKILRIFTTQTTES